jgi:hypothetical protein
MAAAIIFILGASWFGLRHYQDKNEIKAMLAATHPLPPENSNRKDCEQRGALFDDQLKSIKRDAEEQLKIGTKKAEVSRFFAEHNMRFIISDSGASGTLLTTAGCAPVGCGSDSALIGVRVKLSRGGVVIEAPTVGSLYTNCL